MSGAKQVENIGKRAYQGILKKYSIGSDGANAFLREPLFKFQGKNFTGKALFESCTLMDSELAGSQVVLTFSLLELPYALIERVGISRELAVKISDYYKSNELEDFDNSIFRVKFA